MMVESNKGEGGDTPDLSTTATTSKTTTAQPNPTPVRKQSVFGNAPKIGGGEVMPSNHNHMPTIFRNGSHGPRRPTSLGHRRSIHSTSSECISVSSAESLGSLESVDEMDELLNKFNVDTVSSDGECHLRGDSDTTASSEGGLDELEELVLILQAHLSSYRSCREQLGAFEQSYKDSKRIVREMAQELVMKIREHEVRLLEEIETRRETTHKQFQWNRDKIEKQIISLEKLCNEGTQAVRESLHTGENNQLDNHCQLMDTLRQTLHSKDIQMNNMEVRMNPISVNPVRCNTAFATLDRTVDAPSPLNFHNIGTQRRKSVNVNTGSPLSQTGRTRAGSLQAASSSGFSFNNLGCNDLNRRFSLQPTSHHMRSPNFQQRLRAPCLSEDSSGQSIRLLWEITTEGPEPGQVNCPNDIIILPSGDIVVSDRDNHRLQVFSQQGRVKSVIGEGKLNPRRITATKDGNIAVTDSKENVVKVFDTTGNLINTWGKKRFKMLFKSPCAIAASNKQQIIVSDMEKHSVTMHNSDGKVLKQIGGGVEFHSPSYVTVNTNNQILVSDNWNHCIKVFDEQGQYLFQFEEQEDPKTHLKYPNGISCDIEGNIFVADWGSHSVSQFSHDGKFCERILTKHEHGIYHPAGLAVQGSILALSEYSDHHSAVRVYCMEVNI